MTDVAGRFSTPDGKGVGLKTEHGDEPTGSGGDAVVSPELEQFHNDFDLDDVCEGSQEEDDEALEDDVESEPREFLDPKLETCTPAAAPQELRSAAQAPAGTVYSAAAHDARRETQQIVETQDPGAPPHLPEGTMPPGLPRSSDAVPAEAPPPASEGCMSHSPVEDEGALHRAPAEPAPPHAGATDTQPPGLSAGVSQTQPLLTADALPPASQTAGFARPHAVPLGASTQLQTQTPDADAATLPPGDTLPPAGTTQTQPPHSAMTQLPMTQPPSQLVAAPFQDTQPPRDASCAQAGPHGGGVSTQTQPPSEDGPASATQNDAAPEANTRPSPLVTGASAVAAAEQTPPLEGSRAGDTQAPESDGGIAGAAAGGGGAQFGTPRPGFQFPAARAADRAAGVATPVMLGAHGPRTGALVTPAPGGSGGSDMVVPDSGDSLDAAGATPVGVCTPWTALPRQAPAADAGTDGSAPLRGGFGSDAGGSDRPDDDTGRCAPPPPCAAVAASDAVPPPAVRASESGGSAPVGRGSQGADGASPRASEQQPAVADAGGWLSSRRELPPPPAECAVAAPRNAHSGGADPAPASSGAPACESEPAQRPATLPQTNDVAAAGGKVPLAADEAEKSPNSDGANAAGGAAAGGTSQASDPSKAPSLRQPGAPSQPESDSRIVSLAVSCDYRTSEATARDPAGASHRDSDARTVSLEVPCDYQTSSRRPSAQDVGDAAQSSLHPRREISTSSGASQGFRRGHRRVARQAERQAARKAAAPLPPDAEVAAETSQDNRAVDGAAAAVAGGVPDAAPGGATPKRPETTSSDLPAAAEPVQAGTTAVAAHADSHGAQERAGAASAVAAQGDAVDGDLREGPTLAAAAAPGAPYGPAPLQPECIPAAAATAPASAPAVDVPERPGGTPLQQLAGAAHAQRGLSDDAAAGLRDKVTSTGAAPSESMPATSGDAAPARGYQGGGGGDGKSEQLGPSALPQPEPTAEIAPTPDGFDGLFDDFDVAGGDDGAAAAAWDEAGPANEAADDDDGGEGGAPWRHGSDCARLFAAVGATQAFYSQGVDTQDVQAVRANIGDILGQVCVEADSAGLDVQPPPAPSDPPPVTDASTREPAASPAQAPAPPPSPPAPAADEASGGSPRRKRKAAQPRRRSRGAAEEVPQAEAPPVVDAPAPKRPSRGAKAAVGGAAAAPASKHPARRSAGKTSVKPARPSVDRVVELPDDQPPPAAKPPRKRASKRQPACAAREATPDADAAAAAPVEAPAAARAASPRRSRSPDLTWKDWRPRTGPTDATRRRLSARAPARSLPSELGAAPSDLPRSPPHPRSNSAPSHFRTPERRGAEPDHPALQFTSPNTMNAVEALVHMGAAAPLPEAPPSRAPTQRRASVRARLQRRGGAKPPADTAPDRAPGKGHPQGVDATAAPPAASAKDAAPSGRAARAELRGRVADKASGGARDEDGVAAAAIEEPAGAAEPQPRTDDPRPSQSGATPRAAPSAAAAPGRQSKGHRSAPAEATDAAPARVESRERSDGGAAAMSGDAAREGIADAATSADARDPGPGGAGGASAGAAGRGKRRRLGGHGGAVPASVGAHASADGPSVDAGDDAQPGDEAAPRPSKRAKRASARAGVDSAPEPPPAAAEDPGTGRRRGRAAAASHPAEADVAAADAVDASAGEPSLPSKRRGRSKGAATASTPVSLRSAEPNGDAADQADGDADRAPPPSTRRGRSKASRSVPRAADAPSPAPKPSTSHRGSGARRAATPARTPASGQRVDDAPDQGTPAAPAGRPGARKRKRGDAAAAGGVGGHPATPVAAAKAPDVDPGASPAFRERREITALLSKQYKPQKKVLTKARACMKVIAHVEGDLQESFTHFVVIKPGKGTEFAMSAHALLALADGRPIVRPEWLEESGKAGVPLDHESFVLRDPSSERRYGFRFDTSLARARRGRLLEGRTVLITPALLKKEPDRGAALRSIVRVALGRSGRLVDAPAGLAAAAAEGAGSALVLTLDQGQDPTLDDLPGGCVVYSRSAFRDAVIQQSFDAQPVARRT